MCLDYTFVIKCNKRQLFLEKIMLSGGVGCFLFIFQMYSSCIRLQLLFSPCRPHDLAVVNMCVSEVFLVGFLQILGSYRLCKGSKDSLLFRMLRDVEGFWNFFKKYSSFGILEENLLWEPKTWYLIILSVVCCYALKPFPVNKSVTEANLCCYCWDILETLLKTFS